MPYGGLREYGGTPHYGVWCKVEKRFTLFYKGKHHKISRLICEAFHGSSTEAKSYCLHIDENSRNNVPSNLKWGTQKENLNAPGFIAYCKSRVGKDSPTIKGLQKGKG